MTRNKHRGPTLNSFLIEEGIQRSSGHRRQGAISWQLQQAMKKKRITKKKLLNHGHQPHPDRPHS